MTGYLLDNSVIQRIPRHPTVVDAVRDLQGRGGFLCFSDVSRLEAGFSARNAADHAAILSQVIGRFVRMPLSDLVGVLAVELQAALFGAGMGRAVGAVDLLHAATAIVHDAVVIHYDADFELIASVDDRLQQRWIVPPGSVD